MHRIFQKPGIDFHDHNKHHYVIYLRSICRYAPSKITENVKAKGKNPGNSNEAWRFVL